jgi:hypothetical protein
MFTISQLSVQTPHDDTSKVVQTPSNARGSREKEKAKSKKKVKQKRLKIEDEERQF